MKLLRGFTVLDLGTFITAPYAAMLLAELGADVIKVERPEGGDPFRWFAGGLSSPHFQAHNRHKRSVALDYTTPDGLKLLHLLIEHADALVINVRPGVEQRLGIDEGTLRRLNPKLVFCFITGFGADGRTRTALPMTMSARRSPAGSRAFTTPTTPAWRARPSPTRQPGSSPALGLSAHCWSGLRPAWDARSKSACSKQRLRSRSNRSRIIS